MRKRNFFRGKGILLTCVLCITGVFLFDQSVMARKRTSETDANTQTEESTANTEQNTAPGLGSSEEDQAYIEYDSAGSLLEDCEEMYDLSYAVKDLDGDGIHEFIVKGKTDTEGNMKYKYIFYRYKDKTVQMIGSLENWQNGGEGEIYTTEKVGTVVVFWRIADRKTYKVYSIGDSIDETINVYSQDTTYSDSEGKKIWEYGTLDTDGNALNLPVSNEQEWTQFESELKEITFYGDEE